MRHRLSSLLAVALAVGCGDALAPDAIDPPAFAKVTGTFPNSDCQYEQKGNKIKLLDDCRTTNLNGITLAPGTKFDGKKHTVTSRAEFRAIRGTGGSFEIKHVNIVCESENGVTLQGASPDRSKIKVEHVHTFGCQTGIEIENATHGSKISHNKVNGARWGVRVSFSDNVKVDHNKVIASNTGIELRSDVSVSEVSHNKIMGTGTPCEEEGGDNEWKKNKNLTGNPSDPPELCPL